MTTVVEFDRERHSGKPDFERTLRNLIAEFRETQRRNHELQERNGELSAALEEAQRRIAALETAQQRAATLQAVHERNAAETAQRLARQKPATTVKNAELLRAILQTATLMLGKAEQSFEGPDATEGLPADRLETSIHRALALHQEAAALLESARAEVTRNAESEQQALALLSRSRQAEATDRDTERLPEDGEPSPIRRFPLRPVEQDAPVPSGSTEALPDSAAILEALSEMRGEIAALASAIGGPRGGPTDSEGSSSRERSTRAEGPAATGAVAVQAAKQEAPPATNGPPPQSPTAVSSIALGARPLGTFASVHAFHNAVRRIPGVLEAKAVGFDNGRLQLAIRYAGTLPFPGRLTQLKGHKFRFLSIEEGKVEIALD